MMTLQRMTVVGGLVMGLSAAPVAVWAGEHGGTAVGEGKEHGGAVSTAEGSHGMPKANEAALLREAAAALRKGQPREDLAAKLEQLAKEHAQE